MFRGARPTMPGHTQKGLQERKRKGARGWSKRELSLVQRRLERGPGVKKEARRTFTRFDCPVPLYPCSAP
ncbi:hypothetical protein GQ607_006430 [Colletotrichum asianum]|uniref:Uncharacterized protein n=1 Tax=Colletotrichum asianum TaxID=702518 RepID=A0A8H3ZSU0_9PEZI|nr:hypothetical protein GQ607_006430 [Colletotrichum asianum]